MKKAINFIYGLKSKLAGAIAYYPKDFQDHMIIAVAINISSLFPMAIFESMKAGFWYLFGWMVVFIINEIIDHFSDNGTASIKDFGVGMAVILPMMAVCYKFGFY